MLEFLVLFLCAPALWFCGVMFGYSCMKPRRAPDDWIADLFFGAVAVAATIAIASVMYR